MWPPVRAGRTVAIVASVQNTLPKHDPRSTILPTLANFSKLLTFSPTKTKGPYGREKEKEGRERKKGEKNVEGLENCALTRALVSRNRFSRYACSFLFFSEPFNEIFRDVRADPANVERIKSQWSNVQAFCNVSLSSIMQRSIVVIPRVDSGVWVKGY